LVKQEANAGTALGSDDEYVTAREAATILGVSLSTLYVYVGRKGLRSRPVPGTRERRYSRADLERELLRRQTSKNGDAADIRLESAITQITADGPFYRGRSAIALAETASFEDVAALLWDADRAELFAGEAPRAPKDFDKFAALVAEKNSVDRATALIHLLEEANPKAFDRSPEGMARTGVDILRWIAAIFFGIRRPSSEPIVSAIASALELDEKRSDLVRRLLVLSADHGLEPGARAVCAVANTGVTPWRTVATGLMVKSGSPSGSPHYFAVRRLVAEMFDGPDPLVPIIRLLRHGEDVLGFGTNLYGGHDPRARALLDSYEMLLPGDPDLLKFQACLEVMREAKGLEPGFPLARAFVSRKLGVDESDAVWALGRCVGWIAHTIEQSSQNAARRESPRKRQEAKST
jgi:citrate synthase